MSFKFQIIPLGGVGEIGSNMTLLNTPSEALIIDSGILFPDDQNFGINYLIPDLTTAKNYNVTALIITHGHEDHIGAVAHFIKEFPKVPIWAPPFAAELIRTKLRALKLKSPTIHLYEEGGILRFKDLIIHPIQVNHSIPQTFGLLIQDQQAHVSTFFVSDFKYDDKNSFEKKVDLKRLKNLSQKSEVRILLADSTCILEKGKTPSESDLVENLEKIILESTGQIFISFFASNIHRAQNIINLAEKQGRKIAFVGKSMKQYIEVANQLGLISLPQDLIFEYEVLAKHKSNGIYLISGCQGEHRGALSRLSQEIIPPLKIGPKDTFVYSAKVIPGNENQMQKIFNKIAQMGAKIVTNKDLLIHASGHPSQEDLKIYYDAFSPHHLVPIHGETFFLSKHIDFCRQFRKEIIPHLMTNSDCLNIDFDGQVNVIKNQTIEPLLIHGDSIQIERAEIRRRRKVAESGLIVLSLSSDHLQKKFKHELFGLPQTYHEKISKTLHSIIHRESKKLGPFISHESLAENIRVEVRRAMDQILGYKPVTIVHIL